MVALAERSSLQPLQAVVALKSSPLSAAALAEALIPEAEEFQQESPSEVTGPLAPLSQRVLHLSVLQVLLLRVASFLP